jgi:DNA-binding FadR family transcriptional regulator
MQNFFRKARQNRIFQDVVEQIQDAILEGRLQAGQRLPAERELGEMFGTSRGTLREALRVLEQKGLIEIRLGVGGGAVVKGANADAFSDNLALLIRSQTVSLKHLAEFREDVEGTVTGLAARRARKEDNERLRSLLDRARRHREAGLEEWDAFVRVDEKMHMTLARIARNPLYAFILQTIHDNIHRYYERFLTAGKEELAENLQDLSDIVDAVEAGDADRAKRLAREHVRRFRRYMEPKERHETA